MAKKVETTGGKGAKGSKSGQRNLKTTKIGPITTRKSTNATGTTKYKVRTTKGLFGSKRVKTVTKRKDAPQGVKSRRVTVVGFSGKRKR